MGDFPPADYFDVSVGCTVLDSHIVSSPVAGDLGYFVGEIENFPFTLQSGSALYPLFWRASEDDNLSMAIIDEQCYNAVFETGPELAVLTAQNGSTLFMTTKAGAPQLFSIDPIATFEAVKF